MNVRIDETELALLANPNIDLDRIVETMRRVTGLMPGYVVDITDPPTPPRAQLGSLVATGKNPEDAMRSLGRLLRTRYREAMAAAEQARAEQVRADQEAARLEESERAAAAARAKVRAEQAAEDRRLRERLGELEAHVAALELKNKGKS